jgi:hypothetical protein
MVFSRKNLAFIGGMLIVASGLVSIWIGVREGFMRYEPDPGGLFGHVGVLAGIIAIVIGCMLAWIALHEPRSPLKMVIAGLLTMVLGHLGAIAGALLIGTAGMLLCYVTGVWLVVRSIRQWRRSAQQLH